VASKVVRIGVIAVVALAIAAGVALHTRRNTAARVNSLNALAMYIGCTVSVEKASFGDSYTDFSGFWKVRARQDVSASLTLRPAFKSADSSDVEFFKQQIAQALPGEQLPTGLVLYRSSLQLGSNTSCSATPCSVYILTKPGDTYAYIGILKM
jgi:hypothetical protein